MHSVHSWAQMVEQTLVIILFIEHSDMHIYVFPEKKNKKKGKERTHVMFAFICADVQSNSFFWDEIIGSTQKESMLLRIKKGVQIDHR